MPRHCGAAFRRRIAATIRCSRDDLALFEIEDEQTFTTLAVRRQLEKDYH